MADKLILNANFIRKADRIVTKKCAVEKVIELSDAEFKTLIENPMGRNHYITEYSDLMGYYDDTYHGVLFISKQNGDGLLVNSEGYDYARYAQYVPNARDIVQVHEHTAALSELKKSVDRCIDELIKGHKKEGDICITLDDLFCDFNVTDSLINYVTESIDNHPQIADCSLDINAITAKKHELVETKLYCPLKFLYSPDDNSDLEDVYSSDYISYEEKINDKIRQSLNFDPDLRERGLTAFSDNPKVYSAFPSVAAIDGDLYGVVTVKSYGEMSKTELNDLVDELSGQLSDGWGEGFEQREIKLGDDKVYISFWNSENFYLKPEDEAFPEQKSGQTMGGIT